MSQSPHTVCRCRYVSCTFLLVPRYSGHLKAPRIFAKDCHLFLVLFHSFGLCQMLAHTLAGTLQLPPHDPKNQVSYLHLHLVSFHSDHPKALWLLTKDYCVFLVPLPPLELTRSQSDLYPGTLLACPGETQAFLSLRTHQSPASCLIGTHQLFHLSLRPSLHYQGKLAPDSLTKSLQAPGCSWQAKDLR